MTDTEKKIWDTLDTIDDPELNISIVKLGLIYGVTIKEKTATITLTLTTIGCPLYDVIKDGIEKKITSIKNIDTAIIDLTFDPPWSIEKMSEEAKIELGLE
ncbi:MAG: DUF59 domain-containing protein [Candidatus Moranbacteria bacterium]|nr:DUF59 domain-containing protein [Candidatus Moranbacteria bacterium]